MRMGLGPLARINRWFGLFYRTSMVLDSSFSMTQSSCATNITTNVTLGHPPGRRLEISGPMPMGSHDVGLGTCSLTLVSTRVETQALLQTILTMASISFGQKNSGFQVGVNQGSIYLQQGTISRSYKNNIDQLGELTEASAFRTIGTPPQTFIDGTVPTRPRFCWTK